MSLEKLEKPDNYKEVPALQDGETVYAQDHNQIIANIEKIKGGKPNEAPVSNIKELKDILDGILNKKALTASHISFDNEEAKLTYKKYNFPKFKTNIETINLVLTDEERTNEYTAVIEKEGNDYRIKAIISNCHVNKIVCLIIKSVNGQEELELKYNVLSQFFNINNMIYRLAPNECQISNIDSTLVFNISIQSTELLLTIAKAEFPTEIAEGNYNIVLDIKNKQLNKLDTNIYFLLIGSLTPFKLEIVKKDDNQIRFKGHYICKSSLIHPTCYSPILENYFNIIDSNDNLINTDGIISSSGKPKKFGFMRYKNKANTYYLKIVNQDGSELEADEIIMFDLIPDKNAEVEVKEKVIETVQDAIEALNKDIDLDYFEAKPQPEPQEEVSNFEIVSYFLNSPMVDNKVEDCSKLSLVKNADNSYSLKGNIKLYEDTNRSSYMIIKTTNTINTIGGNIKNIIPAIITDNLYVVSLAHENYIYLNMQKINENPVIEESFDNIKLIDTNIVLFNNKVVNEISVSKVSDDFGIVYEDGNYKIKGQLTFSNEETNFTAITNNGISDFFENNEEYSINTNEGTLKAIYHRNNNIMCGLEFQGNAGTTYNIDWVLPKQI
ncbi:peptidase [Brachyspira pilosicoli]|uniref:peptidase n=1 Tax=Brachyspira pilosicoli TaxID=52584 RepID=UPI0030060FD5